MRYPLALACAVIVELGCAPGNGLTDPTDSGVVQATVGGQTIVVTLTPIAVAGPVGDSVVVTAGVTAQGASVSSPAVTWSTRDTTIATVTSTGQVHLHRVGATQVLATTSGITDSADVTVNDTTSAGSSGSSGSSSGVATVRLSPSNATLTAGSTTTVTASVLSGAGTAVSGQTITWTTSNAAAATVKAKTALTAVVTAVAAGTATITGTTGGQSGTTSFVITGSAPANTATAAAGPSSAEYGVHSDLSFDESTSLISTGMQQVTALHANVQRGSFLWHHIESTQGTYNWTYTDYVVNQSVAANVDPLMVVYGSPSWANGTPTSTASYYLYVPQDAAAFATWVSEYATFMSAAATRYKGRVKKWELWNEENQHYFWKPAPNVQQYVTWYNAVYAAIKAADPTCTVSVGGITGLSAGPASDYQGTTFLSDLYAAGLQPDAIAIHPYSNYSPSTTQAYQNSFSDIALVHKIMLANGQANTPLWLTEWGWSNSSVGASTVAQYITQSFTMISTLYPYVTVATYFQLQDSGGYTDGLYDGSGTIRAGGTAFEAFALAHGQ
jgi:hypothetical protein